MTKDAKRDYDWRFTSTVAGVVGLTYASSTVFGLIAGWEGRVSILMIVLMSFAVVRRDLPAPFLRGFAMGFLAGLIAVELQAIALPLYFENNPEYALIEIPFGLSARFATAVFAPLLSTVAGLLTAAIAWGLNRVSKLRSHR